MKSYIFKYLIALMLGLAHVTVQAEDTPAVRLAFIGEMDSTAYLGVLQGLDEANLQGQFLGQRYELSAMSASDYSAAALSGMPAVIVAADEAGFLLRVGRENPGLPVFNVTLTDNDLRDRCLGNVLHVIPSDRMLADAEAQWRKKNPDVPAKARTWHHDFVKFAARDLNKRFKKAHETKMDDTAWAGWAAVKMVTDTIARENLTEPAALLDYLKTRLAFDGQKGSSMTFRPTGQLRQLVLLVHDDNIVAEAPVRGVAKPPTLDSLGIVDCPK